MQILFRFCEQEYLQIYFFTNLFVYILFFNQMQSLCIGVVEYDQNVLNLIPYP